MTPRSLVTLLLSASPGALLGCDTMPTAACDKRGDLEAIDINGDGRPDIRKFRKDGRELCRETDLDFDGRPDTIRAHDPDDHVTYIGHDFDHDGRCDRLEIHTDGVLSEEILDLDGDGRIDLHRTYQGRRILREDRR